MKQLKRVLLTTFLMALLFCATTMSASAASEWYTVDGIVGGQIAFNVETGEITDAETSIVIANIPEEIDGITVVSIGNAAFDCCSNLVSVTIPGTVKSLDTGYIYYGNTWGCFMDCTSLVSVTINEGVEFIGKAAFYGCTSLATINIPNSVTAIEEQAFRKCYNLKEVTLSKNLVSISYMMFDECKSLVSIEIPDNVLIINQFAFMDCSNLVSIFLPKSLFVIDQYAFDSCDSLTDIYYAGSEGDWGKVAVNYDSSTYYNNEPLITASLHYNSEGLALNASIPNGVQYVPFSAQLAGVSNVLSISSGSLPDGLGLYTDGSIRGIPMETGTFEFTLALASGETPYTVTIEVGTAENIEENNDYEILDRVPTIADNTSDQVYRVSGNYSQFKDFYLNGNKLIRDVEYEVNSGSTAITVYAQTFATASTGSHTISATFSNSDGTTAQVSQQVEKTAEQITVTFPYTDVASSAWYYDSVYLMYRRDIIAGTTSTTYSPTSNLTRGMMVDALYQLAGTPAATASSFTDVSADAWYADAVSWAASVGVTQGVGDNMFAPETSITREQMATMIQRYCDLMGITLPLYTSAIPTDLSAISDWAVDSATAMYQYGVLNGDEAGNFNPSGTATRAEAASMFSNFLEIMDRN